MALNRIDLLPAPDGTISTNDMALIIGLFGGMIVAPVVVVTSTDLPPDGFGITKAGKSSFLEKYFTSNDLYVGLWKGKRRDANQTFLGEAFNNTFNLSQMGGFELTHPEYSRQLVNSTDWTVSKTANYVELKAGVTIDFTSIVTNLGEINGYFFCTDLTGTAGKLIYLYQFDFSAAPTMGTTTSPVTITPRIQFL